MLRKACRWFAAVTVETGEDPPAQRDGATIGVDVGVKTLAARSDGITHPKALKRSLGRLAGLQRRKARGRRGSKRNRLPKGRVARLHKRIRDIGRACDYGDSQA